jgi:hypothetical protein
MGQISWNMMGVSEKFNRKRFEKLACHILVAERSKAGLSDFALLS